MKSGFTLIELLITLIAAVGVTILAVFIIKSFAELPYPDDKMSNEQIILETKKCIDAGLRAETYPALYVRVEKVICHPVE